MNSLSIASPEAIRACLAECRVAAFLLPYQQFYLPGRPILDLVVAVAVGGLGPMVVVSDQVDAARDWLANHVLDADTLGGLAEVVKAPVISLARAIRLCPVHIAKPWGQEIWYTGIEARGQSGVTDGRYTAPLPWLLALGEEMLLKVGGGQPNLLKILDPLPEEVFGDLYFELHEQKQEVYVVTGIDPQAWPDGRGAIRYGFDQQRRRQVGDDALFRQRYREAVRHYEVVRRDIDHLLDAMRREEGVPLNAPVFAGTLKAWLSRLPGDLLAREVAAREAMNVFTATRRLGLGDVVKVARLTPHALQHGVRTVEFQTPVYERKILSFAQKVLTQDHWDTEEAVAIMALDQPPEEPLKLVTADDGHQLEQVVAFDDFRALRLTLLPGARFPLAFADSYKVVMVVEGSATVGGLSLASEDAALIPRTASSCSIVNQSEHALVCLISLPA